MKICCSVFYDHVRKSWILRLFFLNNLLDLTGNKKRNEIKSVHRVNEDLSLSVSHDVQVIKSFDILSLVFGCFSRTAKVKDVISEYIRTRWI